MSDGPVLWDRLSGALGPVLGEMVPLGRYQIPAGEDGHVISGMTARPGTYLAAGSGRWTLRHDDARWSGRFGTAPTPTPIVMESIAAIARKAAGLHGNAPLSDWTAIPPLDNGVTERLRSYPLENHLSHELRHLRTVCRSPYARLRTEHVLVPVSQARRITWRTAVHLAAHSETWAARRLHGVEPAQLLTPVQVADPDLYENRVVATLLDRLWRYVLARIAEIDNIQTMVQQGDELLKQAEQRPDYREKERLYSAIADFLMSDDLSDRIKRRRDNLIALRDALAPLLSSELRVGVRGTYTGPSRLRPTNLFDNQMNYGHCRRLWNIEVESRRDKESPGEPVEVLNEWCRSFARFTLVLVLRALEQLGLAPATTEGPQIGRPGPAYDYRGRAVRLDWNHDDTFTLLLDDGPVLRVVPLPHAITNHSDPGELDQQLTALQTGTADRVAVLYPGERSEREELAPGKRQLVHSASWETGALSLVPISPTDLSSTGRVARMLRSALDEPVMLDYPAKVSCRIAGAENVAERLDWLGWRSGYLIVTRPPAPHEIEHLRPALDRMRTYADTARRLADNLDEVNRVHANLLVAVNRMTALLCCPSYPRHGPAAQFVPRDGDGYHCRCPHCSTEWGIRQCQSCRRHYPVLTVGVLAGELGGDGDLLDEKFSQELLAVPCWQSPRNYICRFCGHCPQASQAACGRCQLNSKS